MTRGLINTAIAALIALVAVFVVAGVNAAVFAAVLVLCLGGGVSAAKRFIHGKDWRDVER